MERQIGEQIPLSVDVFKNHALQTGKIVTVTVFDIFGNELLAETEIPETAKPGQYTYVWTNPPNNPIEMKAYYNYNNYITTEDIKIVSKSRDGFIKLKGIISNKKLSGTIKDKTKLGGSVKNLSIAGTIKDNEKLKGKVNNIRIAGTVK